MGVFFTLVYVFTAYMGLPVMFPALAPLHIEIVIAILTLLCSIPSLSGSRILGLPQTSAVLGLCMAVALSIVFSGWLGGAPRALMEFLPNALLFFFILVNFKKKGHLQILAILLLICAANTIYSGWYALQIEDFHSIYLEGMRNSDRVWFARLRGLTFLNDPNDLAQFIAGLIPCMFIFWAKGKVIRNFVLVILPVSVLFFGMFMTHSRGGMIAMMVMAAVAGRKKLGLAWSLLGGGLLFVGLSVAGFAGGGRDISMESGADRMDAWAAGLQMIRSHPLFGVGFGRFTDRHSLTAHNTVVLCAAELGMFGLFSWMLLMVPTVRDALVGSGKKKVAVAPEDSEENQSRLARARGRSVSHALAGARFGRRAETLQSAGMLRGAVVTGGQSLAVSGAGFSAPVAAASRKYDFLLSNREEYLLPVAEVQRLANITLVMLSGFLTAGWFLSRAYTMSVFLYAGVAAVVYRMGRNLDIVPPPMRFWPAARAAAIASVCGVTMVWIILRVNHLLPQ
jgi:O-antigen ligase